MAGHIEIEGLSKSYGEAPAVVDLNLVVEDGEFVTLLGPSGCGKTTTLNLLAGLLTPDEGVIRVDGQEISSAHKAIPPENRQMGVVFQSYALWPHKTVFGNVAYGLQRQKLSRPEIRTRVSKMLDLVGLSGFESRYPGQISGGQQQRVALARSLITEPSILLLDEPLSNLDAKLRDAMRFEVQQIQRRLNTTFIYVTHDQVEAMAMSDQVAVMHLGRLKQFGPPREVYLHPANKFVADFMGLINFLPGVVVSTDSVGQGVVSIQLEGGTTHILEASYPDNEDPPKDGEEIQVALRPEVFEICDPYADSGGLLLKGEVVHSVVLGSVSQCRVQVGDHRILVQAGFDKEPKSGDVVGLRIDNSYARVFKKKEDT